MLALAIVVLLAACGGGDDGEPVPAAEPPASEPTLTRDEVISQGDAICREVHAALAGLEGSGASPAMQMTQRADLYGGMIERLRGLDTDDPALTDVLAAGRDLVESATEANSAAAEGDALAAASAEAELETAISEFRARAAGYGFTECGGEPTAAAGGLDADPEATAPAPGDPGTASEASPPAGDDPAGEPGGVEPPAGGGTPDAGADPGDEPGAGDGEAGSDTGGFSPE